MAHRNEVRVVVLGDEGAGKSTIITAFVSEVFQERVAPVVPPVTVPPEATAGKVTTHIIDTSTRPVDWPGVQEEIRQAHSIVLVYDVMSRESLERVSNFWLPEIGSIRKESPEGVEESLPVILVGNKIDLRGKNVLNRTLEQDVKPIMNEFPQIESVVECSAKSLTHIQEIFYFAQKAVIYPTSVLYDSKENKLRPNCVVALKRIFKLCDDDKDELLNDAEMGSFQEKCFGIPLKPDELEGVKKVIRAKVPDGVSPSGINVSGFLYLHHLFIQRGKVETTWGILRSFGYGDNLKLREDFLCPELKVEEHQTTELSPDGHQFFTRLFQKFDKDRDGALSSIELEDLFATSPGQPWGNNFPELSVTNEYGYVTLQGFLAQWTMTAVDYKTSLRYLAYLGYPGDTRKAISVTKRKKTEIKKRTTFVCYVFGDQDVGKTTFLKSFLGKKFSAGDGTGSVISTGPVSVCNTVYIDNNEKYLVLQEYDNAKSIVASPEKMNNCDLICFLYDVSHPKSFAYVANLQQQILDADYDVPSVFIGTKSDLSPVKQLYDLSPEEFCQKIRAPPPKVISCKHKKEDFSELYSDLIREIYQYYEDSSSRKWALLGIGIAVFAAAIAGSAFYLSKRDGGGGHSQPASRFVYEYTG